MARYRYVLLSSSDELYSALSLPPVERVRHLNRHKGIREKREGEKRGGPRRREGARDREEEEGGQRRERGRE